MQTQPNYAGRVFDRKPENIAKICIESNKCSHLPNRKGPHGTLIRPSEVDFRNGNRIMALIAQTGRVLRRKVFVKEELHASARTTSSPASAAA
jgi:hypothetical protein